MCICCVSLAVCKYLGCCATLWICVRYEEALWPLGAGTLGHRCFLMNRMRIRIWHGASSSGQIHVCSQPGRSSSTELWLYRKHCASYIASCCYCFQVGKCVTRVLKCVSCVHPTVLCSALNSLSHAHNQVGICIWLLQHAVLWIQVNVCCRPAKDVTH